MSRHAISDPSAPPSLFSSTSRLANVGPSRRSAPAYAEYGATCKGVRPCFMFHHQGWGLSTVRALQRKGGRLKTHLAEHKLLAECTSSVCSAHLGVVWPPVLKRTSPGRGGPTAVFRFRVHGERRMYSDSWIRGSPPLPEQRAE